MKRDLEHIKRVIDIELVLQHYGYTFDKSKSSKSSRVYRKGKQRISVIVDETFVAKFFVDLNDPQFKGDIFKFLERMEHGNYRHIFQTIDSIMMQCGEPPNRLHLVDLMSDRRKVEVSDEVRPANYFLKDTLLREQDLYSKYQISPLTDTNYLEERSIAKEILFSKEFEGRIKNVTFDTGVIRHVNTAFPMYARDGNIVSMDIRNLAYKAFPEGERGEALWHSNQFFEAKEVLKPEKVQGIQNRTVARGIIGNIYRQDAKNVVFLYGELGKEKRVILSIEQAKKGFNEVPVQRIVISESAIDAISLKQLNPEPADERRFYIATGGQPCGKQVAFLQEILNRNPQAQLVIAQDGDNAGLRFAVNYLALDHPSENPEMKIKPCLTFSTLSNQQSGKTKENTETRESEGTNRLNLELRYSLALGARKAQELNEGFIRDLLEDMNLLVTRYSTDPNDEPFRNEFQWETMLDENMKYLITRTTVHFPDDTDLLTKTLNRISDEIEKRQGQKLFQIVCPTRQQKDLNDVLRERNGQALPPSHNLKLNGFPIIRLYQEIQNLKQEEVKSAELHGFLLGKNKVGF